MYYQRLLYRQFTNHFISGICDIYNLSVGTNSYTERMIEQRDIRTAVFIALHARKSDRSSYHSSIQGQFGIDYSYTIVTTISDIQFTVFGKADLMGIIKTWHSSANRLPILLLLPVLPIWPFRHNLHRDRCFCLYLPDFPHPLAISDFLLPSRHKAYFPVL